MSLSLKLEKFLQSTFERFPWEIKIIDWRGKQYSLGQGRPHWYDCALVFNIKSEQAGKQLLALNGLGFLEKILSSEVDLEGNVYLLNSLKHYANINLNVLQLIKARWLNRAFQNTSRAKSNVKSHYDISQSLLECYLDKSYMAYSCAMFEDTEINLQQLPNLVRAGEGKNDNFDSLEKAQWRKFFDAVEYIDPSAGETLLDVGCGYGGQLLVALESFPFEKVVGWTHSSNQVKKGSEWLSSYDSAQWELNEGDYRNDQRIYNHITSTGMISHIGPRGLLPYVKNIRRRIKAGGRYVHHALMANYSRLQLDAHVGVAFNKKYVWPGFHWFTLAEHVKALEQNGFRVNKIINLRSQYSKTLTAWYERMMLRKANMLEEMDEATFRAWQIYLGGGAGPHAGDINRIYCEAI